MATKPTKKKSSASSKPAPSKTKTVVRTLEPSIAPEIAKPAMKKQEVKATKAEVSTVPALLGLITILVIASAAVVYVLNKGTEDNTNIVETSMRIQKKKNVSDTVAANASFSTLTKALKAAELTATLKETGPFTIFAPNDLAFGKLEKGKIDDLLKPENKAALVDLLKYHVVSGTVIAKDLTEGKTLTTLQGGTLTVSLKDGSILLTDSKGGVSKVQKADIDATNGAVHMIDTVLMPAN